MSAGMVETHVLLLAMSLSEAQLPGALEPSIRPSSSILKNLRAVLSTVSHSPLQEAR